MNKNLTCLECNEIRTRNSSFTAHLNKEHGMKPIDYALKHNYKKIGKKTNNFKVNYSEGIIKYGTEKTLECGICGLLVTNNSSYLESHIKRIHGVLDYGEYYRKYYQNRDNVDFDNLDDVCGLCNTERLDFKKMFEVDHNTKEYYLKERIVYACNTDVCKNNASLRILGTSYDKKTYDHIGSTVEYLAAVHKKSHKYVRENLKYGKADYSKPITASLKDYCIRYGVEEGTRLYNERNRKIARANTLEYYIEKHGEILGRMYFNERREKIKQRVLGTTRSKVQKDFSINVIDKITNDYIVEYPFNVENLRRKTDFYLNEYDTHIEFFGDYWHASRKIFTSGDVHPTLKITVDEIWKKDQDRINELTKDGSNIIIVWESTYSEYVKLNELDKLVTIIKDILNGGFKSRSFKL